MAIVFNIQRFSVQDGPGIRTTVFIKGCPLRCVWCSNPESQKGLPELAYRQSLCTRCGKCVAACRAQAISLTANGATVNRKVCSGCGACVNVCVAGARTVYGKEMSVDEAFNEVLRDEHFYRNSGGGVSASGGEPLCQAGFVADLFKRCQGAGIHTCLDTCGYAESRDWEKVLPYTSLVLFDLKLMDPVAHRRVTGKSSEKILRGLNLVVATGVPVIVRIPVVPGINDSEQILERMADHIASLGGVREVNLLAYHRHGEGKYKMLGRRYRLSALLPQEDGRLEELAKIFRAAGLTCEIQQ